MGVNVGIHHQLLLLIAEILFVLFLLPSCIGGHAAELICFL